MVKIVENFKDFNQNSGIYGILNLDCNKVYVGQSVNIAHRFWHHKWCLQSNNCPRCYNIHLWRAWKKYGEENFVFIVFELTDDLTKREKHWIKRLKSNQSEYGYNKRKVQDSNAGTILRPLTDKIVKNWISKYFDKYGGWPSKDSGRIEWSDKNTWRGIHNSLVYGYRGLTKTEYGLSGFLKREFGVVNNCVKKDLTVDIIKKWVEQYYNEFGKYPTEHSGIVRYAISDGYEKQLTWCAINQCFRKNWRSLSGYESLIDFNVREFNYVNQGNRPKYTMEIMKNWINKFYIKYHKMPVLNSGQVEFAREDGFGDITWHAVNYQLNKLNISLKELKERQGQ